MGKVYLIGVGPYDEGLITLKALKALEKCHVVLYDRLVNENLLNFLREDCKIFFCGKESGCHYKTQEEINDMLVKFAKEGYTVGRIKGGDPYVFGRGGEEALRLKEENIEFEVIPGITSAIAVLNYAGIPVTHRGISQSFHVFTGNSAKALTYDWRVIAKLNGTIIFLMGLENIEFIVENLLKNGIEPTRECAVISKGTSARQRVIVSRVSDIVEKVKSEKIYSPALIVIGEVINLREKLNWFESKPLFGKRVCITRPKGQSLEFKEKLLELGAEVVETYILKIKPLEENLIKNLDDLHRADYLLFTSANAVNIFFDCLIKLRYDIRKIKAVFGCIGEKTEKELVQRGIVPEIVPEQFVAEALYDKLIGRIKQNDLVIIPRSKNARPFLKEALEKKCNLIEIPIYEVEEFFSQDILLEDIDYFTFTSPSTVKAFIKNFGKDCLMSKKVVAIGPITSNELLRNGISNCVAQKYTIDGIIEKILKLEGYDV
ncbi:MAG: uroporphyrinogen-III C-methyltransferase [Caloramator sp.]|nr:uroporphyrinogen-III C-methyltransferase [Caloramator sp.]